MNLKSLFRRDILFWLGFAVGVILLQSVVEKNPKKKLFRIEFHQEQVQTQPNVK